MIHQNIVCTFPSPLSDLQAIMFPLKSHASKSRTKLVIVIIWIVSTLLAIPMAIAFRTVVIIIITIIIWIVSTVLGIPIVNTFRSAVKDL